MAGILEFWFIAIVKYQYYELFQQLIRKLHRLNQLLEVSLSFSYSVVSYTQNLWITLWIAMSFHPYMTVFITVLLNCTETSQFNIIV